MTERAYKIEEKDGALSIVFRAICLPYPGNVAPNKGVRFTQDGVVKTLARARAEAAAGKLGERRAKNICHLEQALDELLSHPKSVAAATRLDGPICVHKPIRFR